jgi:hypothetical protein
LAAAQASLKYKIYCSVLQGVFCKSLVFISAGLLKNRLRAGKTAGSTSRLGNFRLEFGGNWGIIDCHALSLFTYARNERIIVKIFFNETKMVVYSFYRICCISGNYSMLEHRFLVV